MLRATLTTLMLAFLAFVTFTPSAQATCLDTSPDDDGVGMDGCQVPVLGECNVHALAYGSVPGSGGSCDAVVQCVRECWPPAERTNALPCGGDLNPTDDNGVTYRCRAASSDCTVHALAYGASPIPRVWCYRIACVTEPCATPIDNL